MSPWCPLGHDSRRAVWFLGLGMSQKLLALAVTPRMARRSRVVRPVTPTRRETSRGWSGDLRRSPKAPLNVPSVDPDDQLESVGATPLAPTSLTRLLTEHAAHRGYPAP